MVSICVDGSRGNWFRCVGVGFEVVLVLVAFGGNGQFCVR